MAEGVLLISSSMREAAALSGMLAPVSARLEHASTLADARSVLATRPVSAILTSAGLPDGTWKDVLRLSDELGRSCPVIVTDRLADDLFWAEILNYGAYDLLAQPFDRSEVQRIVESACLQTRIQPQPSRAKTTAIAV